MFLSRRFQRSIPSDPSGVTIQDQRGAFGDGDPVVNGGVGDVGDVYSP